MTTETTTAISKGNTTQQRLWGDRNAYVYLGQYAQFGHSIYFQVRGKKQTLAALTAKVAGMDTSSEHGALAQRFARLGLELAARYAAEPSTSIEANDGTIRALAALEVEIFPQAAPEPNTQPDACRHGTPYSADCAACDADF